MLRASIEYQGNEADVSAVAGGAESEGNNPVVHGRELVAFAEAAVQGDPASLESARDALREVVGSAGLVDAAGVVANFQRMVRIADGAGIALDTSVGMLAEDLREDLGLDRFESAGRSGDLGPVQRALSPVLRRLAHFGFRMMGRRARKRSAVS